MRTDNTPRVPSPTRPTTLRRGGEGAVGLSGLLLALGIVFVFLDYYGDITGFLWVSNSDDRMVAHLETQVGESVDLIDGTGHDGQYFFLQANDPWLLHPHEGLHLVDFPAYRAQRMLYPALAGLGGLLSPPQILWGLVVTNIVAMGTGTWGLARLAALNGMSPWLGLAFALNPGLIFELAIDGGALVGWALAVWGLVAVQDRRWLVGAGLFSGAVLARETMVVVAIGACAFVWYSEGRLRPLLILAPFTATGAWWLVVREQLETMPSRTSSDLFDVPFRGLWEGAVNWIATGGLNLALGLLVVFCSVAILASAVLSPNLLAWATVGLVPLLFILNSAITVGGMNITRAMAPVVSAALVLIFGRRAFSGPARPTTEPFPAVEVPTIGP